MARAGPTDVHNYTEIDGVTLLKFPIRSTWERKPVGVRGTREPRFSAYMSVVHEFGNCTETQHNQFHDFWFAGGLHTVLMAAPDNGDQTTYTGVSIIEVTANRADDHFENTRMELGGILRP